MEMNHAYSEAATNAVLTLQQLQIVDNYGLKTDSLPSFMFISLATVDKRDLKC
jgi:hypothetical protein